MKWVESSGGPMIFGLEKELKQWRGINGDSGFSHRTDYDAACTAKAAISVVAGKSYAVLVLGDDPDRTSMQLMPNGGFVIIRWRYANNESNVSDAVHEFISSLKNINNVDEVLYCSLKSGNHVLFDAGMSLDDNCMKLLVGVEGARYAVLTKLFESDPETCLLLHAFVRAEGD